VNLTDTTMSRRTKIIIAVIVLLLLLLLFAALLLSGGEPEGAAPTLAEPSRTTSGVGLINGTISVNTTVTNVAPAPTPAAPAPTPDPGSGIRQIAKSYAERYGSFSNLGDFENLVDLKVYMTASLAASTDAYIAAESQKPPAQSYFGVTTRAINVTVSSVDETAGTASALVKTQRQDYASGTGQPEVYYQDIVIDLKREDGVWKVDMATWQPK
jgi:hypothetical protein